MAKTVLVMDGMPKRCDDCQLANFDYLEGYCCCMALHDSIRYADADYEEMDTKGGDWRWNKCPLKKLPGKLSMDDYDGYIPGNVEKLLRYYNNGFNDCIDLITGEED